MLLQNIVKSLAVSNLGEMNSNIEIMFPRTFKNTPIDSKNIPGYLNTIVKFKNIQGHLGIRMNPGSDTRGSKREWCRLPKRSHRDDSTRWKDACQRDMKNTELKEMDRRGQHGIGRSSEIRRP